MNDLVAKETKVKEDIVQKYEEIIYLKRLEL
jgi:hypothetical protein